MDREQRGPFSLRRAVAHRRQTAAESNLVGVVGVEPTISCSQSTRVNHYATPRFGAPTFALGGTSELRYAPRHNRSRSVGEKTGFRHS